MFCRRDVRHEVTAAKLATASAAAAMISLRATFSIFVLDPCFQSTFPARCSWDARGQKSVRFDDSGHLDSS